MHATLVASLAAAAAAAPLVSRQAAPPPMGVNDATILNYALSLEHLENAFYRDALKQYTAEDFKKAGLGADFYNNLEEIAKDEKTHVEYLTAGLTAAGAVPVQECTYNFGYTDIQSYLATANILEGVGVSAYLGAAKYLQSPDFLTAAGAILTVEARHSAYLRDNQEPPKSPFPAPFDIPLEFSEVFSLAAQFITGCPDQGETDGTLNLPFKAFPAITAAPAGIVKPGDKLTFTVAKEVEATNAYFITFPGGAIPAEISGSGATYEVVVPAEAQPGQAYVVLTKNGDKPTDDNIVAGPAVLDVFDNAAEFQASHPDYHYKDDDCKDDKPEYPKPEYPSHPEQPEKPKAPEYPSKPEEPKKPEYPAHPEHPDKEHKPEYPKDKKPEYPEKEHKPEHPKKDEYPEKEHKDEHKPEHKDEHKPEHKDEYPEHKDEHVKTPEHPKKDEDCDEYGNPKKHY